MKLKKLLATTVFLFTVVMFLFACEDFEEETTLEAVDVDISEIQGEQLIEEFDLENVSLILAMSDGSTSTIAVRESMIIDEDLDKLSTEGTHTITVDYQGIITNFEVELIKSEDDHTEDDHTEDDHTKDDDTKKDSDTYNVSYMDIIEEGMLEVKDIKQQGTFTLLLTEHGNLFGWGSNDNGELAHESDEDDILKPMELTGMFELNNETIIQIATGFRNGYALSDQGTLFSWGDNYYGQIGNGTNNYFPTFGPQDITAEFDLDEDDKIIDVASGNDSVFVRTQKARTYAFGSNYSGELGDGTTEQRHSPVEITDQFSDDVITIASGDQHTLALTADDKIYAWGENYYGQVGLDEGYDEWGNSDFPTPQDITHRFPEGTTIQSVSTGQKHNLAISDENKVYSWGYNWAGSLGDGTLVEDKSEPTDITDFFDATIIDATAGDSHNMALSEDHRVFVFGYNGEGQLGVPALDWEEVPYEITSQFGEDALPKALASQTYRTSFVILDDGSIYGFGRNDEGQIGNNSTDDGKKEPIKIDLNFPTWQLVHQDSYQQGSTITYYDELTKTDCVLKGWYLDKALTDPAEFETVEENTILYAGWEPIRIQPYANMTLEELTSFDLSSEYDSLEGLYGDDLRTAMQSLISDVNLMPYGDARYILNDTDADPDNPNNLILFYTRDSVSGEWDAGATWIRENVWPEALMPESADNSDANMISDLHALVPADPGEEASGRGNQHFTLDGEGGYEPHDDIKGDAARMLFYMDVMYDDLTLVDGAPSDGAYEMGDLASLLGWHVTDGVSEYEDHRHDVIEAYQGNRNPFIDYPHLVYLIYYDHPEVGLD